MYSVETIYGNLFVLQVWSINNVNMPGNLIFASQGAAFMREHDILSRKRQFGCLHPDIEIGNYLLFF
jgi:hypothetical protein